MTNPEPTECRWCREIEPVDEMGMCEACQWKLRNAEDLNEQD